MILVILNTLICCFSVSHVELPYSRFLVICEKVKESQLIARSSPIALVMIQS